MTETPPPAIIKGIVKIKHLKQKTVLKFGAVLLCLLAVPFVLMACGSVSYTVLADQRAGVSGWTYEHYSDYETFCTEFDEAARAQLDTYDAAYFEAGGGAVAVFVENTLPIEKSLSLISVNQGKDGALHVRLGSEARNPSIPGIVDQQAILTYTVVFKWDTPVDLVTLEYPEE